MDQNALKQLAASAAIDYIKPLLRFTSHRIQKYFESTDLAETMTHEKADLSEGLKFFSRSLASHVKATLKEDEIVKATTELGGSCLEDLLGRLDCFSIQFLRFLGRCFRPCLRDFRGGFVVGMLFDR